MLTAGEQLACFSFVRPSSSSSSSSSSVVGRRRRIFFEVFFFLIISKNLPLKGKFFEMVSRALPPRGVWGAWPPQESPLITRALPPQRPCLAPVPCPQFFFVRNFFVEIEISAVWTKLQNKNFRAGKFLFWSLF